MAWGGIARVKSPTPQRSRQGRRRASAGARERGFLPREGLDGENGVGQWDERQARLPSGCRVEGWRDFRELCGRAEKNDRVGKPYSHDRGAARYLAMASIG